MNVILVFVFLLIWYELNKIKLTYVFILHLDLHSVLSDVWSIIHELVVVVIEFPFVI